MGQYLGQTRILLDLSEIGDTAVETAIVARAGLVEIAMVDSVDNGVVDLARLAAAVAVVVTIEESCQKEAKSKYCHEATVHCQRGAASIDLVTANGRRTEMNCSSDGDAGSLRDGCTGQAAQGTATGRARALDS
jgi:hypothetical protein